MTHSSALQIVGVSSPGLLTYEFIEVVLNKRGKVSSTQWRTAVIDPIECEAFQCAPSDGDMLPVDSTKFPRGWTRSAGLLFIETGPGNQRDIREYSNPFTGEVGSLDIQDVDRLERDTSY
jgi:hypothetical protein